MRPQRLFIVGAGGFGREVAAWVAQVNAVRPRWELVGFLDDDLAAGHPHHRVLARPDEQVFERNDDVLVAIGNPAARLKVGRQLQARGVGLPVLQHPSAVVGQDCRIGVGCILCPGAVLTTNVTLGNFVIVNVHASIGHDARLADGVTLSGHVDITGGTVVDEGAFFGTHASVLPKANVGAFAKVGAGSTVLRSVRPGATVMGVPAKQILP